jgi:asparagine synthase (glutamine-hydrolysing)
VINRSPLLRHLRQQQRALRQRFMHSNDHIPNQRDWNVRLNPDFVRRIDLEERRKVLRQAHSGPVSHEREQHYRDLTAGVQPLALEVLNRVAGALSIEIRHPFWDRRLIEFCLALPPQQKLQHGLSRHVLRSAMKGILPSEVHQRTDKTNFTPNLRDGLFIFNREQVEDVIFRDPQALEPYVNLPVLRKIYDRFLVSSEAMRPEELIALWQIVTLGHWLRSVTEFKQRTGEPFSMPEFAGIVNC